MAKKWVYLYEEGSKDMKDLLGGKGANLAEMANIGLPVPPGFTITTEACIEYYKAGKQFPEGMWDQTLEALKVIEKRAGKTFGDPENPLLVSVRSGAKISMPGMMDTVLNVGLNDETVKGMIKLTNNPRFVYDAYRRLIQMFGKIVLGVDAEKFEAVIERRKEEKGVEADTELTAEDWKDIAEEFKAIIKRETGREFPQDPYEQLRLATRAVFESWNTERAVAYREYHHIPHDLGTAVNIVTMVFGNMGFDSGTGVAFTRDPATGEKRLFGDYLLNAQGEDVVAGIRTPRKIEEMKYELPQVYEEFVRICELLERHYRDVQDTEFTIERGKLWMLQTRTGKRTAQAAVKIAVDMVEEGLISKEEAVMRIDPAQMERLLHPSIHYRTQFVELDEVNQPLTPFIGPEEKFIVLSNGVLTTIPHQEWTNLTTDEEREKWLSKLNFIVMARGVDASPGAATGAVVLDSKRAKELADGGMKVILVRPETNPDDVPGMLASQGILTARGGKTSHAAVVARGVGKPCVVGCEAIKMDLEARRFYINEVEVKEGDIISIDGATGQVMPGVMPLIEPRMTPEMEKLLSYADEFRRLGVWTNADNPEDAKKARDFGAEGIGLCRTEHMFFGDVRRPLVQAMIMAETSEERKAYLDKLLPFQREDFEGIFRVMDGLPVIIRLIDPPMHEFLPPYEDLVKEVMELRYKGGDPEELAEKERMLGVVERMREINPMMGLRGCRTGVTFPEVSEMQVRAIFEAACNVAKEGVDVHPEIMIPLTSHVNELKAERERLEKVAKQVMEEKGIKVDYKFGTMIETPRAAIIADQLARYSDFFSFGTNDLTQMTFGFSRDDMEGKFLAPYLERGILEENPFATLDVEGVGELVEMGVKRGRSVKPELEIGICGEHGGDPKSIKFCHKVGLNYVSCSPPRVPIARLAAAQAALSTDR